MLSPELYPLFQLLGPKDVYFIKKVTFQLSWRPFRDGSYSIGPPRIQFNYINPYKQRPFFGRKCKKQRKGWPKAFNMWRSKQLLLALRYRDHPRNPRNLGQLRLKVPNSKTSQMSQQPEELGNRFSELPLKSRVAGPAAWFTFSVKPRSDKKKKKKGAKPSPASGHFQMGCWVCVVFRHQLP